MFNSSQHHGVINNITGGTFTEIQGNMIQYHSHNTDVGLHTLIKRLVMKWVEDEDSESPVFWIYGPAGAGKSALAQTLAELLQAAGRSYGGSFFFSRGKPGRDQCHHIFTTIAYQLAFHIPGLRDHLNQILYANPALPTKPIDIQMQTLIVEPLVKLNSSLPTAPVIVIDGLDECNGHDAQQFILTVIAEALSKAHTPLRFLVASRPEAHIREMFDSDRLYTITRRLVLDESFKPNNDINIYLRDEFDRIYRQHRQVMADIKKPWPSDGVMDLLVQKASGQFIYAETVLKFVGEEYYRPNRRLDIVLQPTPRLSTSFPDLDALYTQILLTCPHRSSLLLILATILTFHCPQPPEVIEDMFLMERNEVNLVLRSIRSLIKIPGIEDVNGLRFYHASFNDFLVDEDRSGSFFISLQEFLPKFTTSGFQTILRFMPETFISFDSQPHHLPIIQTWGYLKWHLSPHFWSCPEPVRSGIIHDLEAAVQDFWNNTLDDQIVEVSFNALHCALTALVHMMYVKQKWDEDWKHECDGNLDRTLERLVDGYLEESEKKLDETVAAVFYKVRAVLDACYAKEFSVSCMNELIDSVPGFLVLLVENTVDHDAAMFGVDVEIVRDLVEKNRLFIRFNRLDDSDHIFLKPHVKDYLCEPSRSGFHYHDPKLHHIWIVRRSISFIFAKPQPVLENSLSDELLGYFDEHLDIHLDNSDIGPLDLSIGGPMMDLIEDLNGFEYFHEDLWNDSQVNLYYIWCAVLNVLQWLRRQQGPEALTFEDRNTDIYVEMEERLRLITDRILGQILHSVRSLNETVVTLCPPFLEAWKCEFTSQQRIGDSNDPRPNDSPPIFRIPAVVTMRECEQVPNAFIRVSDDLLLDRDVLLSLADYLTNPFRAGNLFIRPEIFYMQFAEYMLDLCHSGNDIQVPQDPIEEMKRENSIQHLKLYLVRALPSERIYAMLRTIDLPTLFEDLESPMDFMKAVVTWLEGHPQPPLDIYIKFQKEILEMEAHESEGNESQLTP